MSNQPSRMVDAAAILFTVLTAFLEIRHYIHSGDIYYPSAALTEVALGMFVRIASRHAGAPAPSVPLHREVLEAIRRRDAEGAHAAMMALIERTSRNVERNVRRNGRKA